MPLDKNHDLIKDFAGTLKRMYNISTLEETAKWLLENAKTYSFQELVEITQATELENHPIYKVASAELAFKKGLIVNWNIGLLKDKQIFVLDFHYPKGDYTSIQFGIKGEEKC